MIRSITNVSDSVNFYSGYLDNLFKQLKTDMNAKSPRFLRFSSFLYYMAKKLILQQMGPYSINKSKYNGRHKL